MAVSYKSKTSGDEPPNSYVTGFVLVIPGIGLYIYILYIIVSKLVYPSSFLPFTQLPSVEDTPEIEIGE